MTSITLKPHQKIPIKFIKKNRGLILYHNTGSGKTITALLSMFQFKNKIIIIGPKTSKKAFYDDMKKLNLKSSKVQFYTFTKIKKLIKTDQSDILNNASVIIDEAHNIRNETTDNLMLITSLEFAHKVILLTATPVINYLNDLAVLVNIIKNKSILPTDIRTFNAVYYDDIAGKVLNREILVNKLSNCISYYSREKKSEYYPSSTTQYIEIDMNDEQINEYGFYIKKYFYEENIGSGIWSINFDTINQRKKNFFLSATRQLSNTLNGDDTFPKIKAIFDKISRGPFPCVIYSNYLKNGVLAITPLLEKNSISYKTITGATNNEKINYIVNNYNNGKYKVLLITSAGSESLDLKNTRQIHIMEPHWNESKITQVIGRSIRYKSHSTLPDSERNVNIYRWVSVFPVKVQNKSADQYLIEISKRKNKIFKNFLELINNVSIEKH
jgi:superfamily II DNA or RNA helicase